MESLTSPIVGDGQLVGVTDQLQPAAEFLCDSDLKPLSLKLADVVAVCLSAVVSSKDAIIDHNGSSCRGEGEVHDVDVPNLEDASNVVDLLGGNGIHMPRAATGLAKCKSFLIWFVTNRWNNVWFEIAKDCALRSFISLLNTEEICC
ncbi:hypothetical protein Nepgr_007971 [Nepenthes gracilis]|uniref:Uncharacterized protein n=1 Tax=Nepenthes gracilis TaxID=150966 RepID=A0AAD3S884_NEPGR|nr:hypothetical protein Nepgr_007971 [Nepenthes gracilis]